MNDQPITGQQVRMIASISAQLSLPMPTAEQLASMTKWEASEFISQLRSGKPPIELDDLERAVMEQVAKQTRQAQEQTVQGRSRAK